MSKNFTIIQSGHYNIGVLQHDEQATSVEFLMKNDETDELIIVTAPYVDGFADVELTGTQTAVVGVYSYQVNEIIPEGRSKNRDFDCADGDCEFGKIIICEALDGVIS